MSNPRISRSQLAIEIADRCGLSRAAAKRMIDEVLGAIAGHLDANEDLFLKDFGTFRVTEKAARTRRNPRTGLAVEVPAGRRVSFRPAKDLICEPQQ